MREYACEYYRVMVPDKSCLLCDHCTDVFWDCTNGPYMFFCEEDEDTEQGALGNCERFVEEKQ